jgi:hypothetical protein
MPTPIPRRAEMPCESRVKRLVDPCGDCHHGGEIGRRARAFVRLRAGADHVADELVLLRHNEQVHINVPVEIPEFTM